MKPVYYLYMLAGCCAVAGCQHAETTKTVTTAVNTKPMLQQPFRFHKLIEVAPGMDYDVFSWGRGPAETGAYMILRSDSVGKSYDTTTGDLDGKIVDAFNTDLDTDGNPEIFIQSQTADSTGYGKIDVYEYNNGNARKIDFPKLTNKQKKGYHGGDDFTVKEGKLLRTYPIYDGDNADAKPSGQKRTLEYSYHGNDFSVKQISTDSTATTANTTTTATPAKAAETQPATSQPAVSEKKSTSRHSTHERSHHSESRKRETRHHEESKRRSSSHKREAEKRHKKRRH